MKPTIDNLKDSFKLGYYAFEDSRALAARTYDMFHGRQYTGAELAVLKQRGQPAESFNIVKLFTRQILGYYSQTINEAKAVPKQQQDVLVANLLNDVMSYVDRTNYFMIEGDKIKLDLLITGLAVSSTVVVRDGDLVDEFGRPIYKIEKHHVPAENTVIDPRSKLSDYSDAEFIHVFSWYTKEQIEKRFNKYQAEKLEEFSNWLNIEEADYDYRTITADPIMAGMYRYFEEYLVVHSIVYEKDIAWSIYWSGDRILHKEKLKYKEVKNPYTVVKLHDSTKFEYYGIFGTELLEAQKAINQAVIQISLLSNTNKFKVNYNNIPDGYDFASYSALIQRVNAVIPVIGMGDVQEISMSSEIQHQYIIIDKAFERIQRQLGINDSFLGMAYAADSGRKVKLQQNATIMALRYINSKLELFYRLDGWKTINLIKQYFRAAQIIRVVDETTGERYSALNQPLQDPMTGQYFYREVLDPNTHKPMMDKQGNILVEPVTDPDTDLSFSNVDIEVQTVNYNDDDEKSQLLLETFLSGNIGQALMTVNPAGFMKAASLNIKGMKSKYSLDLASILEETAEMLQPQPHMQDQLGMGSGAGTGANPVSKTLKLPTNTQGEM